MGKKNKNKHKFRPNAAPAATASQTAAPEIGAEAEELDEAAWLAAQDEATGAGSDGAVTTADADAGSDGIAVVEAEAAPVAQPAAPSFPRLEPGVRRSPFLVLADYEQRSLAHIAGLPEQLDAPGLWRGVAYRVGGHRLASGFDEVVEILSMPQVTPVPGAQPWMLGVANVRGNLLPVVDLKQFLEGERTVLHEGQRVLVVRQPGGDVAVTIDEMYGQRSFIDAQGIDSEAVAEGRYAHFVDRAYRMNDQDWGVFSLERLARTPEFRQAAA